MSATTDDLRWRLRALPSVDRLAAQVQAGTTAEAVAAARAVLQERREQLLAGARDEADLVARAHRRLEPSLRRVLNGTGVVIHTNLGRAPLAQPAVAAVEEAAQGYCNLEMDMDSGRRGARDAHVRELLCELTGAQDGLAVNNGAAAVLLAVAALAGRGGRVAISRGQLVEIGGGFRVPEIVEQAGGELVEVGTTNRTRLEDYERVVADGQADVVLRVHQSNFRTVGFVQEVPIERLCELGVPVIDDVGSGALMKDVGKPTNGSRVLTTDVAASAKDAATTVEDAGRRADDVDVLAGEPAVRVSVAAGAALVCFSGDKLLGGPQAGVLVGRRDAIDACRRHPLARAMRIGRLPLAGLQATLALYRDPRRAQAEIPVLAMLSVEPDVLNARAQRLAQAADCGEVVQSVARVGGGALPLLELCGPVLALEPPGGDADALARTLRAGDPPLVGRIADGRVLIDPRTLAEEEIEPARRVIAQAFHPLRAGRPAAPPEAHVAGEVSAGS